MKTEEQAKTMLLEEHKQALLGYKAKKGLVCTIGKCSRHTHCLRWQAAQLASSSQHMLNTINPNFERAVGRQCEFYVSDEALVMPVGMTQHFYEDMPQRIQQRVKKVLIQHSCRATYYKYHSGHRPINPAMQQLIEDTCRAAGWSGPFIYDSYVTAYDWR